MRLGGKDFGGHDLDGGIVSWEGMYLGQKKEER
jgi:hypothetical protein